MIENYEFGAMTVDGVRHAHDLLLIDGNAVADWWRGKAHLLTIMDLSPILIAQPEVLVVGTGRSGAMQLTPGLEETLAEREIELIAQPSPEAWKTYNDLMSEGRRVAGAFHLTC